MWLGSVTMDLPYLLGFDSESGLGRCQVIVTWIFDFGQVNHLYITNVKINSAFHPSAVGELSTGLFREVEAGKFTCATWKVTV